MQYRFVPEKWLEKMFSERLRTLRKECKITQVVLAEQLGISQQAVGKWETGSSTPDPMTVRKIADIFGVTTDFLIGRDSADEDSAVWNTAEEVQIPVLGTVKAGYGAHTIQEIHGNESANVKNPAEYFYLIVKGDSMEPRIYSGDLALVHRQQDVESGELAVVLVDGEEGTLKRVIKKRDAVILQPFNQAYQAQIFMGEDIEHLSIVGKVIETKTKW